MTKPARFIFGGSFTAWHGAWLCVFAGFALSVLGIYAIDLGTVDSPAHPGEFVTMSGLVLRQTIFLIIGLFAAALIATPHYRWLRIGSWVLFFGMVFLLVFLLIPFVPTSIVHPRNGARAWIELGPIDFQPGELAKVAFVLVIADYLRFRANHRTLVGLIPPAVIAFVPALLIAMQPDLGMATLFAPAIFAMLLAAGARIRHMIAVVSVASCGVILVVTLAIALPMGSVPLLKVHQQARIVGLFHMLMDPDGSKGGGTNTSNRVTSTFAAQSAFSSTTEDMTFQARVSKRMAASGGASGLTDSQTRSLHKYNELPERHNDMILSVVMTRFGLFGGVMVVGLYGLWLLGAYITAATCKDAFGQLVVVGLSAILFAQTFINVGMVLGILPIIGLTLPFVSYGGTSMVTVWVMTGIIFSVGMRRLAPTGMGRPAFEFDENPTYGEKRPSPKIVPAGPRRRG
jgi:cell division protein FtsW (lipid II flippase)